MRKPKLKPAYAMVKSSHAALAKDPTYESSAPVTKKKLSPSTPPSYDPCGPEIVKQLIRRVGR